MRHRQLLSYPIASLLTVCLIVFMSATGCDSTDTDPQVPQTKPTEPITPAAPQATKAENKPKAMKVENKPKAMKVENKPKATKVENKPKNASKTVKAQPFAGKIKRKREGVITTPINAYVSTKDRLVFLQIQDGLEKFRAINGRTPKDLNEVRKKVLEPAALRLPELQAGETYIFDPKAGPYGEVQIVKAGSQ